jgi:trimeric autotransporter adhesin
VLTSVLIMIKGMHLFYDGVMRAVEGVLRAFASIPGPTQKAAKAALSHFMDFKKGVDSTFDTVEGTLQSYKDSVDKLPKKIKLEGDIADLKTKITTAKASLATVPAMDRVFVNANISQLQSQVGKAKSALASVRGKTVYLDLVTRRGTTSSDHDSTIIGHASGGITGSGYSLVGEHGPEVVQLAPGSKVSTAGDTSRMLSASSMSPALQKALNGSSGSSSSSASAARREASAAKAAENRRVAAAKRLTAIYEQIGRDIGRSFEKGIRGTRDDVMRVMDTLLTEVEKSGSKTAERIVRATRGTMLKIAAQRDSLNAALSKAQDKLSNVKGVVNNQRASYEGDADITSGGTGTSYYSLLGNLQNTALHAKQFASKLGQLRKMGLGKTAQQQLLAADPATADQVASSILARGAGGVKEINALQAQISGSARAVGNVGASLAYGATQAQATAAVNNLHSGITKLDKTMAKLAAHMEGVLKQQIKAHAGHAAGGITGSGLVMVGEHGRELVRLSPGSRVYSNGATEGMLSAGGGSGRVTLEVHSGGSRMDDLIVEIIRKSVRVKGGNVQRVLGAR